MNRLSTIFQLLSGVQVLARKPHYCLCVGARPGFGMHGWTRFQRLYRLGLINYIFFEPDHDACSDLMQNKIPKYLPRWLWGESKTYENAIGKRQSNRNFYILNEIDCSSLLMPITEKLIVGEKEIDLTIKKTINITTNPLADYIPDIKGVPFLLQVDTQGTELEVIESLGDYLKNIAIIDCEISNNPFYPLAPNADEVCQKLLGHGFRLYSTKPQFQNSSLIESNAIFVNEQLESLPQTQLALKFII